MKIAIYTRLSPNPDKKDTENQEYELTEFVKRQGWEVGEVYIDIHVSGGRKGITRPRFAKMMEDASKKKFDLLLFWSLDRLSREGVWETLQYLKRLNDWGVNWRSYTEPYLDSCGIFKDAVISILATVAKQEKERQRERTLAGLATAKRRGVKLGNRFATEKTKHRPKPVKLKELIKLRKTYINGRPMTFREIADKVKCAPATVLRMLRKEENEKTNN